MIVLLLILFQGYMLTRCPSGLGMEALLGAQAVQQGLLPYRDFLMHGGPFPVALFSLLFAIPQMIWVGVIFGLFNLISAYGLYKISKSIVPAGLFLVLNALLEGNAFHTETMMLCFGIWGYYFYEKEQWSWMSCMLLASMACKQTGAIYLMALIPCMSNNGRIKTVLTLGILSLMLCSVAYSLDILNSMLYQLGGWTLLHSVTDPWPIMGRIILWPKFFVTLPLVFLIWWSRPLPKPYYIIGGLFLIHYLIIPSPYYMLGVLPWICLALNKAFQKGLSLRIITVSVVVGCFMVAGILVKYVSFARIHGVMDTYYYVQEVAKLGPIAMPVWTNNTAIYFVANLPIPGNNFLAIASGDKREDHRLMKDCPTKIFFAHNEEEPTPFTGDYTVYPLFRGLYTEMRVQKHV